MLNKMTNLEDLKRHFKVLYPNCTDKLNKRFCAFLEQNKLSSRETMENNFLAFITKIMRVDLPQSMSFSESLEQLLQNKEKINHHVDDKKLIPGFITKNILTMPNNRGYIWKNKKYHGKKAPVEGPEVLFEPRRGKTFIHVYEKTQHKIYQKLKGEKTQTLMKTEFIHQQVEPVIARPRETNKKIEQPKVKEKVPVRGNSFRILGWGDSDSD